MPWNLIVLPLLGGFLFLDWCYYSRLRHQRIEGNRLLLESAFISVLLAGLASIIVALLGPLPLGQQLSHFWYFVFPANDERFKYSGTAFLALLLGLGAADVINIVVARRKRLVKVAAYAADQAGDYILNLVFKSIESKSFLTVFMSSRVAYLGYVSVSPTLKPEGQLLLTIAAEGYLHKDSLKLNWHTQYPEWLGNAAKASEYMIAVPMKGIDNAHLFQPDLDRNKGSEPAGE